MRVVSRCNTIVCKIPTTANTTAESNAPNPLHTFPRNFSVDREVANLLRTCWQQVVVMEFRKGRNK